MTDIALIWNADIREWDIALDGADLLMDDGLQTAAVLSLFCDRRAAADDVLPRGATDKRGWWGDHVPTLLDGNIAPPARIGSRMWLLQQERQLPSLLPRVKGYLAEALSWMVDAGFATSLDISASFPRKGWLAWQVLAHRPDGGVTPFGGQIPWGL